MLFLRRVRLGLYFLLASSCVFAPRAQASNCLTQAMMPATERDALMNTAHSLMMQVQGGNVDAVKSSTVPAVAADFGGIAGSIQSLAPMIQRATITVDALYDL